MASTLTGEKFQPARVSPRVDAGGTESPAREIQRRSEKAAKPDVHDEMTRLQPQAASQPPGMSEIEVWWRDLPPMPITGSELRAPLPAPEPLLRPGWLRAIFTELAGCDLPDGEPDVDVLVAQLANQRPVSRIPRRHVKSLRRGLCCLMDRGAGMRPFAADQNWLLAMLRSVVGRDQLTEIAFRGVPRIVELGRALHPNQPVLLISDLGIGRPRFSRDRSNAFRWQTFGRRLRENGHRLIALVPYPPERWPQEVRSFFSLVFWDPATNVRAVRAAARQERAAAFP